VHRPHAHQDHLFHSFEVFPFLAPTYRSAYSLMLQHRNR
jgi:hypothetical protein